MYDKLRENVCRANLMLPEYNLVTFTWGNVSGIDREAGVFAIKPSGVAYEELSPDKIVVLDMEGNKVDGTLQPSSDTLTHLELYRRFENIGGICHTHSSKATMWAQACREIPCMGTTHADYFYGAIPVTETMTTEQIENDYELNTGKVILSRFKDIAPMQMPAVLVANHGPFTWGIDAKKSVENAVVLEQIAETAMGTININSNLQPISKALLDKHYLRKHGSGAYYGQVKK
jgi:L-ribulose-5-phosphate 4-epimerase